MGPERNTVMEREGARDIHVCVLKGACTGNTRVSARDLHKGVATEFYNYNNKLYNPNYI